MALKILCPICKGDNVKQNTEDIERLKRYKELICNDCKHKFNTKEIEYQKTYS